jgi:peptidoglycan/LPS O-acetylase OafA/YrhL
MTHRLNNFDVLRLVAAALVAVLHVVELSGAPALQAALGGLPTQWGLPIFFVLSGHLVFASWMQAPAWRTYGSKRLRRILPAYVAVVLLCAVLGGFFSTLTWQDYLGSPGWWRYLVANLSFLNFLQAQLPGVFTDQPMPGIVNGALWTIKVELMFYAVVPAFAWAVRRWGSHRALGLGFVLSAAWWVYFTAWAVQSGHLIGHEMAKQMPGQLMYFLAGAWAWCQREQLRRWGHGLGAFGLVIMTLVTLFDGHPLHGPDVWDVLAPIGRTALGMWAALGVPHVRALQPRHDLSYGLYLWHFPVIQACVAMGLFANTAWLGLTAALLATVLLAWASWHLIEAPALRRR